SANNHLIGELAGVFVACCTWPCWPLAKTWRREALAGLEREIRRQTHADGVNKEQTTSYQQFVASLFIVAGLAGRRAGIDIDAEYWALVERMIEFVFAVMDRAGNVPMIGDADDGLAFALEPRTSLDPFGALLAVGARLFDDAAWRERSLAAAATAEWLCAGVAPIRRRAPREEAARVFPHGGYYVLGRDFGGAEEVQAVFDAGPLGFLSIAAHGHA